jgi:hypothetical protein
MFSSGNHTETGQRPPSNLDERWDDVLRRAGFPWRVRVRRLRRLFQRCFDQGKGPKVQSRNV